jgi:hypothetical protein
MSRRKQVKPRAGRAQRKLSVKKETLKDLSGSTRVKGGARRAPIGSIASPACLSLTCLCKTVAR